MKPVLIRTNVLDLRAYRPYKAMMYRNVIWYGTELAEVFVLIRTA